MVKLAFAVRAPWPACEFEIGCTLERTGYARPVMAELSLFGPVESVSPAFSAITFPDKGREPSICMAPDFRSAVSFSKSGLVARLTSGLTLLPKDHPADNRYRQRARWWWMISGIIVRSSVLTLTRRKSAVFSRAPVRHHQEMRVGSLSAELTVGTKLSIRRPTSPVAAMPLPSQIDFVRGIADQAAQSDERQGVLL